MQKNKLMAWALTGSIALAPLAGCESLPGGEKEQGAVIGGVGGALAGAVIGGEDNRAIGALLGAAVGAGGGYLIGAEVEKRRDRDPEEVREEAQQAAERAKAEPATPEQAREATTADLNDDGFVTLDEVVAMQNAGLSDREMIRRLERTQQYFQLTSDQERYLRDRGVNDRVIEAMRDMRPDDARVASERIEERDRDVDLRTDPR